MRKRALLLAPGLCPGGQGETAPLTSVLSATDGPGQPPKMGNEGSTPDFSF